MSRSFTWAIVRPSPADNSISLHVAHALAEAFDLDDDIHELELTQTSLPILRAMCYMANPLDKEDLESIITALSECGATVRFSVER